MIVSHIKLTSREQEILYMIVVDELSSSAIAKRLKISVGTVDTHRKHLLSKFSTRSSVGLTKKAIQQGIIKLH